MTSSWDRGGALPVLGPGTRVDLRIGGETLLCRAGQMRGRALHLTVPDAGLRAVGRCAPGQRLPMTMFRRDACWDFSATVHEWIEGRPLVLVLVEVGDWTERQRRAEPRFEGGVDVVLELESGVRVYGRTVDVSERGLSVLLPTGGPLGVGMRVALTFALDTDRRQGEFPIEIVWREVWLQRWGRSLRVGVMLARDAAPELQERWKSCVAQVAVIELEEGWE